jgi:diguanylate cyclase (GGDEF)-like protein
MKLLVFFYFFMFFSVLNSHSVQASDAAEKVMAERLEVLRQDNSIPPLQLLGELEELITVSSEKRWQENQLTAVALKVEILLMLEQLVDAERLITEYLPLSKASELEFITLRFELSLLTVADAKGFNEDIVKEQNRLLEEASVIDNPWYSAAVYLSVGQSQYVNSNFEGALQSLRKAYDIYKAVNETQELSDVMNALANVYIDLNDSEGAIRFYKEAIEIKASENDQFSISILKYNLGKAYLAIDDTQKAKRAFEESKAISVSIEDSIGILWAKYSLAEIYLNENKPKLALDYFKAAAQSFEQSGDRVTFFHTLIGQVNALIKLDQLDLARQKLEKAEALLPLLNNVELTARHTYTLATLEAAFENYQAAFQAQRLYSEQESEIFKTQQAQDSEKLRIQFDVATQESRNQILESENEIKSLRITKQQEEKTFWMIIILLAVFVIIVGTVALIKVVQHRNRFKNMALRDHLTNSPNRRAILQFAQERYQEAKYTNMELSIGIIDLDHFKQINDTYGHETGDEVLKAFSEACNQTLRKQDRYGRYGGEEWLLVLSDTNHLNIQQIFDRLKLRLNEAIIDGIPDDKNITFSMGIAQFDTELDDSLQAMINRADKNLYQAKSSGRNQLSL